MFNSLSLSLYLSLYLSISLSISFFSFSLSLSLKYFYNINDCYITCFLFKLCYLFIFIFIESTNCFSNYLPLLVNICLNFRLVSSLTILLIFKPKFLLKVFLIEMHGNICSWLHSLSKCKP